MTDRKYGIGSIVQEIADAVKDQDLKEGDVEEIIFQVCGDYNLFRASGDYSREQVEIMGTLGPVVAGIPLKRDLPSKYRNNSQ